MSCPINSDTEMSSNSDNPDIFSKNATNELDMGVKIKDEMNITYINTNTHNPILTLFSDLQTKFDCLKKTTKTSRESKKRKLIHKTIPRISSKWKP